MYTVIDPLAPRNLLTSWFAGLAALPLALITSVAGQGLGAVLGGATWIGVTLPLHRQPWALVNEPTLNFASTPAATGYWLGSLILPALIALIAVRLLPRPRTVAGELTVIQAAFALAVGGLGWLPLIDPVGGHLARWLALHHLPSSLLLVPPLAGAVTVLPGVFRLLSFQRTVHQAPGASRRFGVTLLHFLPPALLWIGLGSALAGRIPILPTAGVLLPVAVALLAASVFSAEPWVLPLEPGRTGTPFLFAATALVLGGLVLFAGRPLPGNRAAGILWAPPNAFNNVRPWVVPVELFAERSARPRGPELPTGP